MGGRNLPGPRGATRAIYADDMHRQKELLYSEPAAFLLASVTSVAVLLGVSEADCMLRTCVNDDAGIRATELFGNLLLILYVLLSWALVFPAMLAFRERYGRWRPAAIVSMTFALLGAALLHNRDVDGGFLNAARLLVPFLGTPWFAGGFVALTFWPRAAHPE